MGCPEGPGHPHVGKPVAGYAPPGTAVVVDGSASQITAKELIVGRYWWRRT
jgi:hypothetical protein